MKELTLNKHTVRCPKCSKIKPHMKMFKRYDRLICEGCYMMETNNNERL